MIIAAINIFALFQASVGLMVETMVVLYIVRLFVNLFTCYHLVKMRLLFEV